MRRRIGLVLVVVSTALVANLLAQANAGLESADPGLGEAEKVLDCDVDEGVFAYHATWSEGSGFQSPREAVVRLLAGKDFEFEATDFVSRDVEIRVQQESAEAKEFTVREGESDRVVTWAVPVGDGWLADSIYGCTTVAA